MKGALEIISPGFQSFIQDKGRTGFQEFGIPICGSVTSHWMELGNCLVGNDADDAGIEFRVVGPTLKAVDKPVKLAVCANVKIEIISGGQAQAHTHKVSGWRSFTLNPDEEAKIGVLEQTVSGFIAISGGVDVKPVMGSKSTYVRSELGGLDGGFLKPGDRVKLGADSVKLADEADKLLPSPPVGTVERVRVVLGPQEDFFEETTINQFLKNYYTISKQSDRMGARLEGGSLRHKKDKGSQIISDGVVPGAIQVPGNGQPIVLLNDGQTVGGYPKIATVISTDLHLIANSLPGTEFCFEAVSAHEACVIARQAREELERMKRSIVAASANGFINLKALYESNLIGGVVDMGCPDHFPGHLDGDI
ncbi:allophanate hydrolase [Terasakiella brassicae]|uniref:Allophanate hydrolase n=1 Tax=Terasakiella brassicae TaxID=1634917 RepID=A0A917FF02_9PROT|nr:biotin-dependent carboxyltransferase family protein [Terasakiella brassicae]GGF74844.1 allophanate hydrolase [Terasakiella brassicae]